jgi:hypothetical protein
MDDQDLCSKTGILPYLLLSQTGSTFIMQRQCMTAGHAAVMACMNNPVFCSEKNHRTLSDEAHVTNV